MPPVSIWSRDQDRGQDWVASSDSISNREDAFIVIEGLIFAQTPSVIMSYL